MLPGRVVVAARSGRLSGYGNVVVLEHRPGLFSLYAHLDRLDVGRGERVGQGAELGTVGDTAGTPDEPGRRFRRSAPHLHLEFLDTWPPAGRDRDRLDPAEVLGRLGVILPRSGPPVAACGNELGPVVRPETPSRGPSRAAAAAGGALALLLLLAAYMGHQ